MRANVKTLALLLLAACGDDAPSGEDKDPSTADSAAPTERDASTDARVDARVTQDARVEPPAEDARVEAGEDARVLVDANVPVDAAAPVDAGNQDLAPVFVAVGYSGARLVSRDLGKTWVASADAVGGGDDGNLLRSVAFANGTFVAIGSKIWTSTDAKVWTERQNPASQWNGGIEFGNGVFVACGGVGRNVFSADGATWTRGKDRADEHGRSLAFGNGKFMCATDKVTWWSSTDGNDWTKDSGGHGSNQVMWCDDRFSDVKDCKTPFAHGRGRVAYGMGVYVSADGQKIERSEDNGKTWTTATQVRETPVEDVAFGML